mmetsp:Transcript_34548/g.83411  ORF Transcript_34548/g.83411 Transcript_34548/m.83411 type:complete len:836 (+) Transcript_34548:435-2942(+)
MMTVALRQNNQASGTRKPFEDEEGQNVDDPAAAPAAGSSSSGSNNMKGPPEFISSANGVIGEDGTANNGDGGSEVLVLKPGEHDVLLGRGGGTNNHEGNINFRNLVNQHKMRYLASSKIDKPKVAKEVVQIWKSLTPPGRFLQKKEPSASGNSPPSPSSDASKSDGSTDSAWVPVSDKKAREKASQCLRERTADVMPYLSQLQQQRDHMREQGVSMISQHLAAAQQNGEELPKGRPQGRYGSLNNMGAGGSMSGMMSGRGGMDHQLPHNRRISMPAGRSPATPVTPMNAHGTPADRRMSMPVGGSSAKASMVPSSAAAGRMGMASSSFGGNGMEQQVLQDAYSAIERAGGPDPANVMFMEQLLQEERMMEREKMLAERQALMQERMMMQQERMMMQQRMSEQMSPYSGGRASMMMMMGQQNGWSPMMGGNGMQSNYAEMMFQQQQMMMAAQQEQQQLSAQPMMMGQHLPDMDEAPNSATSNGDDKARLGKVDGKPGVVTVVDMEPIPFLEDGSTSSDIPLSIIPDVTKSLTKGFKGNKRRTKKAQDTNKTQSDEGEDSKPAARVSKTSNDDNDDAKGESQEEEQGELVMPLKEASQSGKLKSAFRRPVKTDRRAPAAAGAPVAAAAGQQPTDEANLLEYRKTLENYMSAHKINAPTAADTLIDDDFSDGEDDIGVDAAAWVTSTLNDSGSLSMNNTKKKKRTKKSHQHLHHENNDKATSAKRDPERGVGRTKSNESFMSTDAKSFDGKSMDGMSLMSLAISEVEDKMRSDDRALDGCHDSMESLEEGSVNFDGRDKKDSARRSSFMSSNQSIMSELTDFSDHEQELDSDDEEDDF